MSCLVIGLLSGTSMDGVDAVLVDLADPKPVLLHSYRHPIPTHLYTDLLQCVVLPGETGIPELGELDSRLGILFGEATLGLLKSAGKSANEIMAIGSHGQTVYHAPDAPYPFSMQLGDPSRIAEITGITTVAGFRDRDIAAGGQGAPLVPGLHAKLFRDSQENRIVLNIGGIANITVLPRGKQNNIEGFDTGPGNTLLDCWYKRCCGTAYDEAGAWAASGTVHQSLLESMLLDPFFQQVPPKSTGRERFNLAWLEETLNRLQGTTPTEVDVQATLAALTARTIADVIRGIELKTQRVLVCGGGVHNDDLMARLRTHLADCKVDSTMGHGLDPDWVEAVAFAWLAKQTLDGKPGNIPGVTGAKHPVVLGAIYHA